MRGNSIVEETAQIIQEAVQSLQRLLPPGWNVAFSQAAGEIGPADDGDYDASIVVRAPGGRTVVFLTEVKTGRVIGADQALERLRRLRLETGREVLLIAPYLGPALRSRCEERDVNYLDLTGWCWVKAAEPAMAIRATGAPKDPQPSRSSIITRFDGAGAGRVIRTLLETELPIGVRELGHHATVSAGTVSKVLKELDSEAIVARDVSGRVANVRKRQLVERWTRDYSFLKGNSVTWCLAPRGIPHAIMRALEGGAWATATGSLAMQRLLPDSLVAVTPISQLALYVPQTHEAADMLGLVAAERAAANVLLAVPYDTQLLDARSDLTGQLPVVDVGQVLADLRTMPGRAPQEADQLMDALAQSDEGWR